MVPREREKQRQREREKSQQRLDARELSSYYLGIYVTGRIVNKVIYSIQEFKLKEAAWHVEHYYQKQATMS